MRIIEEKFTPSGRVRLTGYIQEPAKEMQAVKNKPAVLVFPGGAYSILSRREAEPIALSYAAQGFQAFILWYSVEKNAAGFAPLKEASRAIKMIRDNSEQWHVIPDKIAVCGFSAGGHLACAAGLLAENRPNAMILCYPAIDFGDAEENKKRDNKIVENLLGTPDYTQEELDTLNLHLHVQKDAPPAFIWHTCGGEILHISQTIKLATAYSNVNCPFEYHVFQRGEHGLSLATPQVADGRKSMVEKRAQQWFELSVSWLWEIFGELEVIEKPFVANFEIEPEE